MINAEKIERVILGWSPDLTDLDEYYFVVSPVKFCRLHKLSPCQSGVVSYLSRYQYEKNPWLVKQSLMLIDLMLCFGNTSPDWVNRIRELLGQPTYLAPRLRHRVLHTMSMSTYCTLNGIALQLLMPMSLVCNSPNQEGLKKARELLSELA